ncbi:MAG: hypothetical protein WCP33_04215 [Deltaproteobacteria bacterium]
MKVKRLTMQEREEIWKKYQEADQGCGDFVVKHIACEYQVSRNTIYTVLEKGQNHDLTGSSKWLSEPEREEIRWKYALSLAGQGEFVVSRIAREYDVSRPTIYTVIEQVSAFPERYRNMRKSARKCLTRFEREEIWRKYQEAQQGNGNFVITKVAGEYQVSRPTIYEVLAQGKNDDFARRKWLAPSEREEIRQKYVRTQAGLGEFVVSKIALEYEVSRTTIYAVIHSH